jgi:hypothetical protein
MTSDMFDKIVKARAMERVEAKINAFKKACLAASRELLPYSYIDLRYGGVSLPAEHRAVFALLASDNHGKNWPVRLWQYEEGLVAEELLKTLDEMQRALLAAEKQQKGENDPAGDPSGAA